MFAEAVGMGAGVAFLTCAGVVMCHIVSPLVTLPSDTVASPLCVSTLGDNQWQNILRTC
jgi:hypothetical protein